MKVEWRKPGRGAREDNRVMWSEFNQCTLYVFDNITLTPVQIHNDKTF
jgi:hypothetical protein